MSLAWVGGSQPGRAHASGAVACSVWAGMVLLHCRGTNEQRVCRSIHALGEGGREHCRRGWLPLWNLESESDWLDRLRQSPPKVVAVFLRWSPTAPRIGDFDLLLCLNRPLQEPERGLLTYWVQAKVEFLDGSTDSIEMQSGPP